MSINKIEEGKLVSTFPPLYGKRRALTCPAPVRTVLTAGDGAELHVYRITGGNEGPVILAPGTAMSGLCFLTDTTEQSFAEYLSEQGFDVWLFDWRTSPYLPVHKTGYTFDDVARYDWPVVIQHVRKMTGTDQVSILAHCLSAPCILLSLLRGYSESKHIKALIPSQVGLHLVMNRSNRVKMALYVDKILPSNKMVHQSSHKPRQGIWDFAVGILAVIWPKSYTCKNHDCARQSATYGDIVYHGKINEATHGLMGDLVPEVNSSFLKDVAPNARAKDILNDEDRKHLSRLNVPMLLISGEKNQMFLPASTQRTWELLHHAVGANIQRQVFEGFGHLDCYLSGQAKNSVWKRLAEFLKQ